MAPLPLTGTIGTSSSLRAEGEAVPHRRTLPEPVVTFHLPLVKRPGIIQVEKTGRKAKQTLKDEANAADTSVSESELSIDASHILLQSLRQSRLIYLSAMLPHLSTRHRANTKYHSAPVGHPFPGGLEPPTTPHSLIHLGRADVRIGPLIFPKTRFGEVRVERASQGLMPTVMTRIDSKEKHKKGERKKQQVRSHSVSRNTSPGASTSASTSNATSASTGKPTIITPTITAQPAIDDAVVQAVSKAGQQDPKLQALLHKAANGKAAPDELRDLAKFISQVSERLEKEKKSAANTTLRSEPPVAKKTDTIEKPGVTSAPPRQIIPSPQVSQPSHSPIVTIEFRENPSTRFILPLWRRCTVERISQGGVRSIKVTMLLPAIGSVAALKAHTAEGKMSKKSTAPREVNEATPKESATTSPTEAQLTAAAPIGAETHTLTYLISGSNDTPLSDGIWQCFGRVKSSRTIVDGKVTESGEDEGLQKFIEKLRADIKILTYTPKLQVTRDDVMKDLSEHLADKFVPRMHTFMSKPVVKLKKGDVDVDDIEIVHENDGHKRKSHGDKTTSLEKRQKRISLMSNTGDEGHEDGGHEEDNSSTKPKRKRHVAKYNPDGSLKLCQACGTNSTPMWRRGPAGKSTLCNACGAKWKVGRLVISGEGEALEGEEGILDTSISMAVDEEVSAEVTPVKEEAEKVANGNVDE